MSEYGFTVKRKTESKIHLRSSGKKKNLSNYYDKADRMPGQTGANLMILLESRLDNVVFVWDLQNKKRSSSDC